MMLTLIFEATLRTVLLAALAGLGLSLFRVHSSTVKLAVWRVVLYASLLMPIVSFLPKRTVFIPQAPVPVVRLLRTTSARLVSPPSSSLPAPDPIDWSSVALRAYALVTGLLLLRAVLGLLKLRQVGASAVPLPHLGPDVFASSEVAVPVTYGVIRPRILLPTDSDGWTNETLDAVLAHERAHIAERDFATQCLSKINRAMYWANPLVWWLDRELAVLAEHSSDDAALSHVAERHCYAAMLLGFAEQRSNLAAAGVAIAGEHGISGRIERVLDEARLLSMPLSIRARIILAAIVFVAAIGIGACQMTTVSAQTAPTAPVPPVAPVPPTPQRSVHVSGDTWWSGDRHQTQWVLVTPRGTSMNGSSDILARARSLGSSAAGRDYLIFIQNGKTFLLDDAKTISEIEAWFQPMEELGRQQGELGDRQGALGDQMGKLGEEMAKLGEQMSRVTVEIPDVKKLRTEIAQLSKLEKLDKTATIEDLSELQSRIGELQSLIGEAQSRAGGKQSQLGELQAKIGEQQASLGAKQAKLGEEQARLGEQQSRIAEEAEKKLRRLFDEAIQDGRAKAVR